MFNNSFLTKLLNKVEPSIEKASATMFFSIIDTYLSDEGIIKNKEDFIKDLETFFIVVKFHP